MTAKTYKTPLIEIFEISTGMTLLAGSVITPGANNEEPGSREFDFDDEGFGRRAGRRSSRNPYDDGEDDDDLQY